MVPSPWQSGGPITLASDTVYGEPGRTPLAGQLVDVLGTEQAEGSIEPEQPLLAQKSQWSESVVVDDDAADVAAFEHVVVGLVDVAELVLGGDGFIEQ